MFSFLAFENSFYNVDLRTSTTFTTINLSFILHWEICTNAKNLLQLQTNPAGKKKSYMRLGVWRTRLDNFTTISLRRNDGLTCKYIWLDFFLFCFFYFTVSAKWSFGPVLKSQCQHWFQPRLDSWIEQRSPHRELTIKGLDCGERWGGGAMGVGGQRGVVTKLR